MEDNSFLNLLFSLLLVAGSFFFVAAEYGLIGVRKGRIDTLAKKGSKSATVLSKAIDDLSTYIAGIQIAITMIGIGIGAITEPFISHFISNFVNGYIEKPISVVISVFVSTFFIVIFVVIFGELVPKYITLKFAEPMALTLIRPLRLCILILKPLIWFVRHVGGLILTPFGVDISKFERETLSKEEIAMLIKTSGSEGIFEEEHAQMVAKALKLDKLDAADLMLHRLDMKWLDVSTPKEKLFKKLAQIPHTRIPVCDGDIDNTIGILYLPDIPKYYDNPDFELKAILHPVVVIPENLRFSKLLARMRENKSQILIVVDEYGGTSGMITLEDVIEEVFGEFQDQLESERPTIEWVASNRISARAEVRYDEVLDFLGLEVDDPTTDSLANIVMERLRHIPVTGDSIVTELGLVRIENMARTRITRVSIILEESYLKIVKKTKK